MLKKLRLYGLQQVNAFNNQRFGDISKLIFNQIVHKEVTVLAWRVLPIAHSSQVASVAQRIIKVHC